MTSQASDVMAAVIIEKIKLDCGNKNVQSLYDTLFFISSCGKQIPINLFEISPDIGEVVDFLGHSLLDKFYANFVRYINENNGESGSYNQTIEFYHKIISYMKEKKYKCPNTDKWFLTDNGLYYIICGYEVPSLLDFAQSAIISCNLDALKYLYYMNPKICVDSSTFKFAISSIRKTHSPCQKVFPKDIIKFLLEIGADTSALSPEEKKNIARISFDSFKVITKILFPDGTTFKGTMIKVSDGGIMRDKPDMGFLSFPDGRKFKGFFDSNGKFLSPENSYVSRCLV